MTRLTICVCASVLQGLDHILEIGLLLSDRMNDLPLFEEMSRLYDRDLQIMRDKIESMIELQSDEKSDDAQGSNDAYAVHVKIGVDEEVRSTSCERDC